MLSPYSWNFESLGNVTSAPRSTLRIISIFISLQISLHLPEQVFQITRSDICLWIIDWNANLVFFSKLEKIWLTIPFWFWERICYEFWQTVSQLGKICDNVLLLLGRCRYITFVRKRIYHSYKMCKLIFVEMRSTSLISNLKTVP